MKARNESLRAFTVIELAVMLMVIVGLFCMVTAVRARPLKRGHPARCVNNLKQIGLAFKIFANDNDDRYPVTVSTNSAFLDESRAWVHFQTMSKELQTARVLMCPEDKARTAQRADNFNHGASRNAKSLSVIQNRAVSYFVGIEMDETKPQGILAGDRSMAAGANVPAYSTKNLRSAVVVSVTSEWSIYPANKLHDYQGDLLLGDGSVQQASVSILVNQLKLATNSYGTNVNRFVFPQ
jgi:hypothetical protein